MTDEQIADLVRRLRSDAWVGQFEAADAIEQLQAELAKRPMMTGIWPKKAGEDTIDLADERSEP